MAVTGPQGGENTFIWYNSYNDLFSCDAAQLIIHSFICQDQPIHSFIHSFIHMLVSFFVSNLFSNKTLLYFQDLVHKYIGPICWLAVGETIVLISYLICMCVFGCKSLCSPTPPPTAMVTMSILLLYFFEKKNVMHWLSITTCFYIKSIYIFFNSGIWLSLFVHLDGKNCKTIHQ